MAALVGIEPTTVRLTGDRSSTELQGNDSPPGQNRTDDLLCFKQALLPTELPGEVSTEREGFEPSSSYT